MATHTRTVMITGSAGNPGRCVAASFHAGGANVVLVDLRRESLEKAFGAEDRVRLASALMTLASMAKPSPRTRPSVMQRRSTLSNTWRNASLSRKRPCRFLEKVEWSGTASSRSRRQNQR